MAPSSDRLTSNTGEVDISTLLSNNAIFEIPLFQRPYKWQKKQLDQLHTDILTLVDGTSDLHFLGAIIIHGRQSDPGRPRVYELIDGQQRLTTIYLHICAAVSTLIEQGHQGEAEALFTSYLVTRNNTSDTSNLALHPSLEDRRALNEVVRGILATDNFGDSLQGFKFRPLVSAEGGSNRIVENYKRIKRFYREQTDPDSIDRIKNIYAALLNQATVVQINVQDPTNGPKIFDSLNSGQHPMTVGDLVRNDVFSKVAAEDPLRAAELNSHAWQPFYQKFQADGTQKNHFDNFFYPYSLIQDHSLKQSEAYSYLRRKWRGKDPEEVIAYLREFQDPFLDLVWGSNSCNHPSSIARRFNRLFRLGLPSSTFPFLMRLSREFMDSQMPQGQVEEVLDVIDSFLTRRAICGYEPTGLHAVFKSLWADCKGNVTADEVIRQIDAHKTVAFPRNEEVIKNIKTRPIYGARITKYLIVEYDKYLGGDEVPAEPWIEHVLPNTYSDGWKLFSRADHAELKDVLANLIPLSPTMNGGLGNKPYSEKRPRYAEDSMYKSARNFANIYDEWTPDLLRERAELLANWAVERWRFQPEER